MRDPYQSKGSLLVVWSRRLPGSSDQSVMIQRRWIDTKTGWRTRCAPQLYIPPSEAACSLHARPVIIHRAQSPPHCLKFTREVMSFIERGASSSTAHHSQSITLTNNISRLNKYFPTKLKHLSCAPLRILGRCG